MEASMVELVLDSPFLSWYVAGFLSCLFLDTRMDCGFTGTTVLLLGFHHDGVVAICLQYVMMKWRVWILVQEMTVTTY